MTTFSVGDVPARGMDEAIDRIIREHETTPPKPAYDEDVPAEIVALYDRIGSARLFDGRWQIVPLGERRHVDTGNSDQWAETLIDLSDGRTIAVVQDLGTRALHWMLARIDEGAIADDPADVPLLGSSLALLLHAALDRDGDIAHLETGRLIGL